MQPLYLNIMSVCRDAPLSFWLNVSVNALSEKLAETCVNLSVVLKNSINPRTRDLRWVCPTTEVNMPQRLLRSHTFMQLCGGESGSLMVMIKYNDCNKLIA